MSINNGYKPLYHSDINETFIIEPILAVSSTITACTEVATNLVVSCSGDSKIQLTSGETIFNTSIIPDNDAIIDLGTSVKRYRNINTVSGMSTVWESTVKLTTPTLDLGVDSNGNNRIITANNSIIQNDILLGGTY